jgi:hypothetical protein
MSSTLKTRPGIVNLAGLLAFDELGRRAAHVILSDAA